MFGMVFTLLRDNGIWKMVPCALLKWLPQNPLFSMIVAFSLLGDMFTLQKLLGVVTVVIALTIYTVV